MSLHRIPLVAPLTFLVSYGVMQARAQAHFTDDFSRYAADSDASPAWETNATGWKVRQKALESDGRGRSLAFPAKAPHARRMVVETTLSIQRAAGTEWKVAGLTVRRDGANYWHLALIESPDSLGKVHTVELTESVKGRWLANFEGETKLTVTADKSMNFSWQYDHPYRLRIEINPEGITGTVLELDGTERAHRAYSFDKPAVTTGRPALVTDAFAATFDDFQADIQENAPAPPEPTFPTYTNPAPGKLRGKRTGYFHVEQIAGRWWLIDPAGRSFYAVGTDHVNYDAHWCEKLGYAPYHRNVEARYGSEPRWAQNAIQRLKQWGFNTLGAGHSPSTRHQGLVHTEFLSLGANFTAVSDIAPRTTWTGFPDVFHPRFARWCEQEARRLCAPNRNDPWLLGYFLDNELEWFGKNGSETGLVDEVFKKPADHPAKLALIAFLRERYPTISAFNRAWKTNLAGWEALAQSVTPLIPETAAGKKDQYDFVLRIADRYFALTSAAIRKADPNHMVIGCRFAGIAPPGALNAAGRYCDIVTVNYYGQVDLERGISPDMPGIMRRYFTEAQRPLMITEWSFPALDAGLPSQHGAGQRVGTQKEKARAYSVYQRALFQLPFMVGSDYFMWADEPALGISATFPEDSNYGLVDVNDNVWKELTDVASRVNRLAHALHAGETAELSAQVLEPKPGSAVIRLRNKGKVSARFTAKVWIQGRPENRKITLKADAQQEFPVKVNGSALVSVSLDPEETVIETDRSDNTAERVIIGRTVAYPAIVVSNPSGQTLCDVPVSVPLGKHGKNWTVQSAAGQRAAVQVDDLPEGIELALRVPELPARSVLVYSLKRGTTALAKKETGGDRNIVLPGSLRLEHEAGSGDFLDHVSLDALPLGRFRAVIHQVGAQPLWVAPNRITSIERWDGPVRTVLLMTATLDTPEAAAIKTTVNVAGVYAPQERSAKRCQITFRLTRYTGEDYFSARFLRLQNTDAQSWRCAAYYHYPLSSIAGNAADDLPRNAGGVPMWHDASAGASLGAIVDMRWMKTTFWKDTPDGTGEHADIWRDINKDLKPDQTIQAGIADPEVLIFGARDTEKRLGGDTLERLRALSRIRATLH